MMEHEIIEPLLVPILVELSLGGFAQTRLRDRCSTITRSSKHLRNTLTREVALQSITARKTEFKGVKKPCRC